MKPLTTKVSIFSELSNLTNLTMSVHAATLLGLWHMTVCGLAFS